MLCPGLFLYEQTDGTDVGKTGGGDVPAAGPLRFPAHFYGNLPPSIWKERMEGLAGVNAASIEQQTGGEDRSPPGRATGFALIFPCS